MNDLCFINTAAGFINMYIKEQTAAQFRLLDFGSFLLVIGQYSFPCIASVNINCFVYRTPSLNRAQSVQGSGEASVIEMMSSSALTTGTQLLTNNPMASL